MKKGKYICLEGSEGVGKTTQVKRLVAWLISLGYSVFETKEPGTAHSPLTMILRGLVLNSKYDTAQGFNDLVTDLENIIQTKATDSHMTSDALSMLDEALTLILDNSGMNKISRELITQAIRNIHLQKVVAPALLTHDFVIQDRGILSGLSYGDASGVDISFMNLKNELSVKSSNLGSSWNDCYDQILILQGNVANGLKRAQQAKQEFESGDVMEQRGTTFLDKVNDNFNKHSASFKSVSKISVDGKSIEQVFSELEQALIR